MILIATEEIMCRLCEISSQDYDLHTVDIILAH